MKYYKKSRLKKYEKKEIVRVLGVLLASALAVGEGKTVYAAQLSGSVPDDGEELISVEFPVIPTDDSSPFNFILDPQGLINATHAVRYGGRNFEEGATLYFENKSGEYDFSHTSDFLTVTNRSAVPVRVRVRASLENREEIGLSPENFFEDAEDYLYLALVDDEGGVYPFDREGKAEIVYEMTEQTESGLTNYSFGLTGACNPDADWSLISVEPHITVTWTAEPVAAEEESKEEAVMPAGQNASAGTPDSLDDAAEDGENAEKSDGAEENGEESSGEENNGTDGIGAEDMENGDGTGAEEMENGDGTGAEEMENGGGTGAEEMENGDGTGAEDMENGDGTGAEDIEKGDGTADGTEESGAVGDDTEDTSISENTAEEGIAQ